MWLKSILNKNGITLVEIVMTFAVIGIVICPLMTMFVTSYKISNYTESEYKTMLLAQKYLEEIESMKTITSNDYIFNLEKGCYERNISHKGSDYTTKIRIIPVGSMLYNIEVNIIDDGGKLINKLESSKIFR